MIQNVIAFSNIKYFRWQLNIKRGDKRKWKEKLKNKKQLED
jgi:hypothetical protein